MSGPSRVFLHIGLPKTGTTYLQEALWLNRDRLAERGLYLPGARRQHLLASLELREDPGLANRPRHIEHPWTHLTDLVRTRLRKKGGDALISHEFFASATPAQVERAREAFPDAELHVVLTARPTVDLFTSRWQEWVKNGNHLPIDSYPPEPKGVSAWGWATSTSATSSSAGGACSTTTASTSYPSPRGPARARSGTPSSTSAGKAPTASRARSSPRTPPSGSSRSRCCGGPTRS